MTSGNIRCSCLLQVAFYSFFFPVCFLPTMTSFLTLTSTTYHEEEDSAVHYYLPHGSTHENLLILYDDVGPHSTAELIHAHDPNAFVRLTPDDLVPQDLWPLPASLDPSPSTHEPLKSILHNDNSTSTFVFHQEPNSV